ncbi:hypothetical protein AB0M92_12330 [Streptomyces sp. NPDC051582]|uniref:hypothetical protein n=1 Tax=Streptomyces sp. NPDC051582 TaxID=3155167 RepID=UPI00342093DE
MEDNTDQRLRGPGPAVEAQREALAVWRPSEDELLAHRLRAGQAAQAALPRPRPRLRPHEQHAQSPGGLRARVSDLSANGAIPSAEVLAELASPAAIPRDAARALAELRAVGELAVEAFPGAGIPNLLALTLSRLAEAAALPAPILTEPFASATTYAVNPDLFPAAWTAADLLMHTPYARYYGIDCAALRDLAERGDPAEFAELCARRAGLRTDRRTAPDGAEVVALAREAAVGEQARVLTTFNMATLVRVVGIDPPSGWDGLARGAFTAARRRSATPKRVACAWRQLVFHLSLCDAGRQAAVLAWIEAEFARLPRPVAARLSPDFTRLRAAAAPPTSSGTRLFRRVLRP